MPGFYIPPKAEEFAPLKEAVKSLGYRCRVFVRASHPLNYDSKVRPKRNPGMAEMCLNNGQPGKWRVWFWVECPEAAIAELNELAMKFGYRFDSIGYPQEAC